MRELRVWVTCDRCRRDFPEAETLATGHIAFTVDGRAKRYDHCEAHGNPTWLELLEMSNNDVEATAPASHRNGNGNGRKTARPQAEFVPCDVCGKLVRGVIGITTHKRLLHGATKSTERYTCLTCRRVYKTFDGLTRHQADTGHDAPGPPTDPQTCPDCGRTFGTVLGVGIHRSRAHNVPGSNRHRGPGQSKLAPGD